MSALRLHGTWVTSQAQAHHKGRLERRCTTHKCRSPKHTASAANVAPPAWASMHPCAAGTRHYQLTAAASLHAHQHMPGQSPRHRAHQAIERALHVARHMQGTQAATPSQASLIVTGTCYTAHSVHKKFIVSVGSTPTARQQGRPPRGSLVQQPPNPWGPSPAPQKKPSGPKSQQQLLPLLP